MKRLLALVALAACGSDAEQAPIAGGSGHERFAMGPAAGGGFVPGTGASPAALAGSGLSANGAQLAIDPTYTQRRVSGSCGAGQSVQVVNQDGTVTCASAGAGTVTSGTLTTGDLQAATGVSGIGNYAGSTPSACSAGQAVTQPALSAAGALTTTCSSFVTSSTLTNTDLVAATAAGAVANYAGSTAASCLNGQGFTGAALSAAGGLTGTCGNVNPNSYGGTHLDWRDEWLTPNAAATFSTVTPMGSLPWQAACSGTSAQVQAVGGVTGRPGVMEFTAGTTSTGKCSISSNPDSVNFGDGNWTFQWVGGVGVQSSGTDEFEDVIGFNDSLTVNATDGCWFLYDRGNTASSPTTGAGNTTNEQDLECRCASNGTTTAYVMDGTVVSDGSFTTHAAPVGAVTYPNTNIMNLQIVMTGSTEADFFYNGTKSCKITTNIPTGSLRLTGATVLHVKSAGTTSGRTLDTDFTDLTVDLTSARSP